MIFLRLSYRPWAQGALAILMTWGCQTTKPITGDGRGKDLLLRETKGPTESPIYDEGAGLLFDDGRQVIWPTAGRVSSEFGRRGRRDHRGIDIAGGLGRPIVAVEKGRVLFAGWRRGYGRLVIVQHAGYQTLYGHCRRLKVKRGQSVRQGQLIALMGASGNARAVHLHFEWRSLAGEPLDPRKLLPAHGNGSAIVRAD